MNLFTKARSLDNTLNDISFITIFWWIKTSLSAYDHEDRHRSFPVPFHTSFTPLVASTAHEKQDTAVRLLINPPKTISILHPWGLPTMPGLFLSTFQPSQRGFFRIHTCVWREREPEPEFSNFSGPQASIPWNWWIGFGHPCYNRTSKYAYGTDSLKIYFCTP
jgi:hypothetical protein